MNTFEDDAVNDDFEVASSRSDFQLSDLDPEEARPISSAIAILCSRISFKARGDDAGDASPDDDFEVEITDLPVSDEENRIPSAIAALRSRISLSPHLEESGSEVVDDDFEVEITDLPTTSADENRRGRFIAPIPPIASAKLAERVSIPSARGRLIANPRVLRSPLPRKVRMLRMATVGIAILIMLGVVLGSVPSARDAVLGLFPRPTPTPTPAIVRREFGRFGSSYSGAIILGGDISISSTPIAGAKVIPWNPNTPVANVLNPPPQACPSANVPQDSNSVAYPYGNRVGSPPLWIMGFAGYFETVATLIGFTRANPPQYGWARQVTLLLESNAYGPVTLQGAHLLDGTPLLFSDPDSGQAPSTFLTLSLDTSSSSNAGNNVIGGIADIFLYIPAAGCYYLKASWAGGSWEVVFAAGQ